MVERPPLGAPQAAWVEWINSVAPLGGPTSETLPAPLRWLSTARDRELAAVAAENWFRIEARDLRFRRAAPSTNPTQPGLPGIGTKRGGT